MLNKVIWVTVVTAILNVVRTVWPDAAVLLPEGTAEWIVDAIWLIFNIAAPTALVSATGYYARESQKKLKKLKNLKP